MLRPASLLLALWLSSTAVAGGGGPPTAAPGRPAAPAKAAQTGAARTGPAQTGTARAFTNPVIAEDFADPDILKAGRTYYAYSTNAGGSQVPTFRSGDLLRWEALGDALPVLPAWASGGNTWAPDVLAVKGGYALYFTARHTESGRQCIGVAFAPSPQGPFKSPSPKPLVCQLDLGGSIDANGFTDAGGQHYLYWKNDGNCCNQATAIWVQPLSPDGQKLSGKPKDLIYNNQLWEGNLIEAPYMVRHGSKYYLFYSASAWDSDLYAVGYAVGSSPSGPFKKVGDAPLLPSTGPVAGPGGQGVITDGKGQSWMYYHAWDARNVGYQGGGRRALYLSPLTWQADRPQVRATTRTSPAPAAP